MLNSPIFDCVYQGASQRKVRAPKGRVPGNAWGAKAYGKCRREQTADGSFADTGKGEKVR